MVPLVRLLTKIYFAMLSSAPNTGKRLNGNWKFVPNIWKRESIAVSLKQLLCRSQETDCYKSNFRSRDFKIYFLFVKPSSSLLWVYSVDFVLTRYWTWSSMWHCDNHTAQTYFQASHKVGIFWIIFFRVQGPVCTGPAQKVWSMKLVPPNRKHMTKYTGDTMSLINKGIFLELRSFQNC